MIKESTHRADELKDLGWSNDDIARYVELWDYRQRWGAINLEREDRLFLRKAEAALPKILPNKASVKKPTQEKSYYRRLRFYLDSMNEAENAMNLIEGERGIWPILLEEELRLLDYYEPVLGLPDTLKAKKVSVFREDFAKSNEALDSKQIKNLSFDFGGVLEALKAKETNNWKPLRDDCSQKENNYPVLEDKAVSKCRTLIRKELSQLLRNLLPSLIDTDKPEPPDNWSRD